MYITQKMKRLMFPRPHENQKSYTATELASTLSLVISKMRERSEHPPPPNKQIKKILTGGMSKHVGKGDYQGTLNTEQARNV